MQLVQLYKNTASIITAVYNKADINQNLIIYAYRPVYIRQLCHFSVISEQREQKCRRHDRVNPHYAYRQINFIKSKVILHVQLFPPISYNNAMSSSDDPANEESIILYQSLSTSPRRIRIDLVSKCMGIIVISLLVACTFPAQENLRQ